jgi:hypothetical protein
MKSLGISVEETAIIYGVFPLFSILAPYTMGIIADKLGNFKVNTRILYSIARIHFPHPIKGASTKLSKKKRSYFYELWWLPLPRDADNA